MWKGKRSLIILKTNEMVLRREEELVMDLTSLISDDVLELKESSLLLLRLELRVDKERPWRHKLKKCPDNSQISNNFMQINEKFVYGLFGPPSVNCG